MNLTKDFLQFLRKNGAFKYWMLADRELTLMQLTSIYPPKEWLIMSHIWSENPPGDDYWRELNTQWEDYLKKQES